MKVLVVGLLLASFVGLEFFHELWGDDARRDLVCSAPESKQGAMTESLLQHLRSH